MFCFFFNVVAISFLSRKTDCFPFLTWRHIAPPLLFPPWPLPITTLAHFRQACFQNLQKYACPLQTAKTKPIQRKSAENCGHMPGEAPRRTDAPWGKSANINPSCLSGFSPTSNNKEALSTFPTMLSHRHPWTRALEVHIHLGGGVSHGISHTCQWIAHNSCIDTSELLGLGLQSPRKQTIEVVLPVCQLKGT